MVQINVTVELGAETKALLSTLVGGVKSATPGIATITAPVEEEKPKAETPKKEAAPRKETPKKDTTADFDAMDDDAKLEAIKTEVTKHTKKGKSADIKALLTHFDAGRASELAPEQYGEFYNAILRYGKGESLEAITGGGEDLS